MRRTEWEPPTHPVPGQQPPAREPEWGPPSSEPNHAPGIHDPPPPGESPGHPGIIA